MPSALDALLADYDKNASAALRSEEETRRELSEKIAALERTRALAFRQARFMRLLAKVATAAETEQDAVAWQRSAVRTELGWHEESVAHETVLDKLSPVCVALWRTARDCEPPDAADAHTAGTALAHFEAWFLSTHGKSFYALFDQYVREVPVVDF